MESVPDMQLRSLEARVVYTPYSGGRAEVGMPNTNPEAALPRDRPPTVRYETYPTPGLVPYRYANPVTGR